MTVKDGEGEKGGRPSTALIQPVPVPRVRDTARGPCAQRARQVALRTRYVVRRDRMRQLDPAPASAMSPSTPAVRVGRVERRRSSVT